MKQKVKNNSPRTTSDKRIPEPYLHQLKRLLFLLLVPLTMLLVHFASKNPQWIEGWFSQGFYPIVSTVLGELYAIVPFSVVEWLLYALVISAIVIAVVTIVRSLQKKIALVRLVRAFVTLLITASVLFSSFYFCWGFNYYRPPIKELLQLDVKERPVSELNALCQSLAQSANALRAQVPEDENGVFTLDASAEAYFAKIPQAYKQLGKTIELFSRPVAPPKSVFSSECLSWMGIAGIYFPFTAEANVNVHQPPLLMLVSAAHECAHAMGIARENEANFVGYLACLSSDEPSIAYSGTMLALIHSGNQLSKVDPEAYADLFATYSDALQRDLFAYNAYWKAYEGPLEETMSQMNDAYLKYHQQQSGIRSYGEVVDLLLAWHAQSGEFE